jgi:small subunit ribosomal protein S8
MLNDTLSVALSNILNAEKVGKTFCLIKPSSRLTLKILELMKSNLYIGDYEIINPSQGGEIRVELIGRINKCGVIKPRFSVKIVDYVKFEKRYLPAVELGFLIVSTPKGIMTHKEAIEKNLGGSLLAYVY